MKRNGPWLFVRVCDGRNPPGSVRTLGNGLWVGHIDRLSVDDLSFDVWLRLYHEFYWLQTSDSAAIALAPTA
jgi:hypothetical protein